MKSEQVGMRENKSGEFFPQYFASGFGKKNSLAKISHYTVLRLPIRVSSLNSKDTFGLVHRRVLEY